MTTPSPAPRRRHRLLWSYVALLLLSHLVRLLRPAVHQADPDEKIATVAIRSESGAPEPPTRVAYRMYQPLGSDSLTPTLVLLHGSPGDNGEVTALSQTLGEHYRTIYAAVIIAPMMPTTMKTS